MSNLENYNLLDNRKQLVYGIEGNPNINNLIDFVGKKPYKSAENRAVENGWAINIPQKDNTLVKKSKKSLIIAIIAIIVVVLVVIVIIVIVIYYNKNKKNINN